MAELPSGLIEEMKPLIRARQVLLIGEVHGTVQYPALIEKLVRAATADGLSVTVGLELPSSETAGDFGPFWTESVGDGRTSRAMAELITGVIDITAGGADVHTVFFDLPYVTPGQSIPIEMQHLFCLPRDQVMAEFVIEQIDRRPDAFTVILAGNVHTQVVAPRRRRNRQPPPMAAYLARWYHDAVSLMGKTSGGEAWVLVGQAKAGGPRRIAPDRNVEAGVRWSAELTADRHHGHVHIGRVTASPRHAG